MAKRKLERFAEMETFPNVFQPQIREQLAVDYELKGKWKETVFKNQNSLTLELGCGKGEYTLGLAHKYPEQNFIGLDIKGARIWRGAKSAIEQNVTNVAFLRTKIDLISSFFAPDEIEEFWITFPDPQPSKPLKRLTSSVFLNRYRQLIGKSAVVNLKTDSYPLFEYSYELVKYNHLPILTATHDLYNSGKVDDILNLKTFYETQHLKAGKKICYLRFIIFHYQQIREIIQGKNQ